MKANPGDWWQAPRQTILVGTVTLSHRGDGFFDATAHVTVPEITTGSYYFMLCDTGCRTPLGDVIPQRVDVAGDAFSAQLARKLTRSNFALQEALARQRRQLRREIRQVERELVELKVSSPNADEVARLNDRVAALERDRPSTPWPAYAGWFVAGAAVSFLALTVIRRRRDTASEPPLEIEVPDDARELAESR